MILLGCAAVTIVTFGTIAILMAMFAQDFDPIKPANTELEKYLTKIRG